MIRCSQIIERISAYRCPIKERSGSMRIVTINNRVGVVLIVPIKLVMVSWRTLRAEGATDSSVGRCEYSHIPVAKFSSRIGVGITNEFAYLVRCIQLAMALTAGLNPFSLYAGIGPVRKVRTVWLFEKLSRDRRRPDDHYAKIGVKTGDQKDEKFSVVQSFTV